jgi:hypothetical protein
VQKVHPENTDLAFHFTRFCSLHRVAAGRLRPAVHTVVTRAATPRGPNLTETLPVPQIAAEIYRSDISALLN